MKKRIVSALLLVTALTCMACGNAKIAELKPQAKENSSIDNTAQDNIQDNNIINDEDKLNEFGLNLLKQNINEENPVLSPISAYLALNMVACGSNGNTKKEFEDILGTCEQQEQISKLARKELIKDLEGMKFSINDSIWIDDMFEVKQDWVDKVMAYEGNKSFQVNLSDDSTVDKMNDWIDKSTNGLIQKMIEQPFSTDDRLVIFDALYMKGKWEIPFSVFSTFDDSFSINNKEETDVTTMHMFGENLQYFSNDVIEGTVLPYQDSNLAFVAIKPKDKSKYIKDIISSMNAKDIYTAIDDRHIKNLDISLPVFDITCDLGLKESLNNMGISDAFSGEKADLTGLGLSKDNENLYICDVRQKARIKVNEEGTEAAAVTEVTVGCESVSLEEELPYELFFKEPFCYMIIDIENKIPVFIGIMDNPSIK